MAADPARRYLGNALLSLLTKIASGYWHVADSQSGFTAASLATLEKLDLDRVYPRYGFPNDMLVTSTSSRRGCATFLAPGLQRRRAVGIRYSRVIPAISWLLLKAFFWRLWQKYVIRDFHPLVFFYVFGIAMFIAGSHRRGRAPDPRQPDPACDGVLVALLLLFGSQFTLFAMWFDLRSATRTCAESRNDGVLRPPATPLSTTVPKTSPSFA